MTDDTTAGSMEIPEPAWDANAYDGSDIRADDYDDGESDEFGGDASTPTAHEAAAD